jgi:hypothetical protein
MHICDVRIVPKKADGARTHGMLCHAVGRKCTGARTIEQIPFNLKLLIPRAVLSGGLWQAVASAGLGTLKQSS